MNKLLRNRILLWLLGIVSGSVLGYLYFLISGQSPLAKSLILGAMIGLLIAILLPILRPGLIGYKCKEIHLTLPQFSDLTFIVDDTNRRVAWSLFIETITRISTQPLKAEQGFLIEALNSLYSLFQITRDLLKSMEPSKNIDRDQTTVEMFAISMLNDELRPFLSKWHPLLTKFISKNPDKLDIEWELNLECRQELEQIRLRIKNYAMGFGELAEVKNLEYFFKR